MITIITEELKYSTIYDHYKETVNYLKKDLIKRDKITLAIFILFSAYFLVEFKQVDSVTVTNILIKKKVGLSLDINYTVLSTAMLLLILGTTVKYFQMCLNIQKQYDYIHNLENKINIISDEKLITRKGYSYLKEYPLLSALIHRIYNFFLPLGIILSMSLKIYKICKTGLGILTAINIVIGFLIILCTSLHLLFVYRKVNFVKWLNKSVKKLFVLLHLYKEDEEEI